MSNGDIRDLEIVTMRLQNENNSQIFNIGCNVHSVGLVAGISVTNHLFNFYSCFTNQ